MKNLSAELVGTAEACQILGIDRSTLTRWAAKGIVEPVHVMPGAGGAKLFARSDILRLARAREREEAAS
jgi:predicted site-specific integrase-resolvase